MQEEIIPVFYACDDNFFKYTLVSMFSLRENVAKSRRFRIHILHAGLSEKARELMKGLGRENFEIEFDNVNEYLCSLGKKLPVRESFSGTTYFRMFIADLFPGYDRAIYLDSDTIVEGDVSELYDVELADNLVAAAHEQVMLQTDVYGNYVEKCLGIDRNTYFNAGMLVINCAEFRTRNILSSFVKLLKEYNFVVTQDEDYLNLLCKDRVHWLGQEWNCEIFGNISVPEAEQKLIHYIMSSKPWRYADCREGERFLKYADRTLVGAEIREELGSYTEQQKERDALSLKKLAETARRETEREDNYFRRMKKKRSPERLKVLEKIEALEREGIFDRDVENNPPAPALRAEKVDYPRKKLWSKIKTRVAFKAAEIFVDKLIEDKRLIVKEIKGLEYFHSLQSGAVITCNHFNAFDSFAVHLAYYAADQKKRKLFRVIREGNFTNFPGLYGFFMKNCNTLPLSSGFTAMKNFMMCTDRLLREGNFVLFYPEQSMWWNYRKPKPLKNGAYKFAARNNVPVLPCFITMRDSDVVDEDGFYVQEYTIHIAPPLFPDKTRSTAGNAAFLRDENYRVWKEIYEKSYGIPLAYSTVRGNERIKKEIGGTV